MPHTHGCARRWADLDLLGHVNNVRYLDYVTEAREALLGTAAGAGRVVEHRVQFEAPMRFSRRPAWVDSWVTGREEDRLRLAHEVYDVHENRRTVHLRASTVLDTSHDHDDVIRAVEQAVEQHPGVDHVWRPLLHRAAEPRSSYAVEVRRSDVDDAGTVTDTWVFELLQEARVRYVMELHERGQEWTQHVVARTDVRFLGPIHRGDAEQVVHSWIGHVGTASFTICSEVRRDDSVLVEATVVMVTFDTATQRSAPMADSQRARLQAELDH